MPLLDVITGTSLRSVLGLLVASSIKATLVIALAAIVVAFLRRGPAALKHQVWAAGLAGALLMPVLTLSLPSLAVHGLPDWRGALERVATPVAPSAEVTANPPMTRGTGALVVDDVVPNGSAVFAPATPTTVTTAIDLSDPNAWAAANPAPAPRTPESAPVVSATRSRWSPPSLPPLSTLVVLAWLAGVAVSLALLVAGRWGLWRAARRARPVTDPVLLAHAHTAARDIGLARRFELLEGPAGSLPVTWGVMKPVVLLPAGASAWPVEALRAVLIHELAHVARRDCLTQTLGQLARALYWFHPAIVHAERQLRCERERACDDRVLGASVKASDYADQILDVVRRLRGGAWTTRAAVAFARRSSLEGRILALLDPGRDRRPSSLMGALRVTVAFAAFAVVLAVARPGEVAATAPTRTYGSLSTDLAPAEAHERMGEPAEFVALAEEGSDLGHSWKSALESVEHEARPEGDWIGYRIPEANDDEARVLTDSGDIFVEFLSREYRGPSLADALVGKTPGLEEPSGLAVLLHVTYKKGRGAVVDRMRAQCFQLPSELKGQRLLWLGDRSADESVEWLEDLDRGPLVTRVQHSVIDVVGLHPRSESAVRFLAGKAEGRGPDAVRAEAAEALARQQSDEALEVLERLARQDHSTQVRREAIEALGEMGRDDATQVLLEIARDDAEAAELRREALESLGEQVELSELEALASLEDAADAPDTEDGAPEGSPSAEPRPWEESHPVPAPVPPCGATPAAEATAPPTPTPPTVAVPGAGLYPRGMFDTPAPKAEEEDGESEDEFDLQRNAVEALGRMPEALSLPKLIAIAAEHPSLEVRKQAVESMGALATDGAIGAIERLIWKARQVELQVTAVEVMARFSSKIAVRKLVPVANSHPAVDVRRAAIECLGRFPEQAAVDALDTIIRSSPDLAARASAIDAVSRLPLDLAIPRLAALARSELPASLRRLAIEWLGRSDPEAALPVLEELLEAKSKK